MASRNFCDCCDGQITGHHGSIKIAAPQDKSGVPSVHLDMVCDHCITAICAAVKARGVKQAKSA